MTRPIVLDGQYVEMRSMYPQGPIAALKRWSNDPELAASMNMPPHRYGDEDIRRYLATFDGRTRYHFGVYDKASKVQIGFVVVIVDDAHSSGMLHIAVCEPRFRRSTHVVEMGILIHDWAFGPRKLAKLSCRIDATRKPFAAMLLSLGFPLEGTLRSEVRKADGSGRIDHLVFGVLPSDWPAIRERGMERIRRRLATAA